MVQNRKKLSDINLTVVIRGAGQEVDSSKRSVYKRCICLHWDVRRHKPRKDPDSVKLTENTEEKVTKKKTTMRTPMISSYHT